MATNSRTRSYIKERCLSLHTETETRNDSSRHPRGNDLREGHGEFGKDAHLWNTPSYAPKNDAKAELADTTFNTRENNGKPATRHV